ncbi:MAG: Hsp33 family molecular chaperone HslO [candidate division WOR-3 bacterium]
MGKALLTRKGNLVFGVINSTDVVAKARDIHKTSPTATALLGRVLTGSIIYSLMIRGTQPKNITVEIVCFGPAKRVIAQVRTDGRVRGYIANPNADLPVRSDKKLDVAGIVEGGIMRVIREGYVSEVPLISGEIGEDFAYFLYQSEQRRSAVGLGVLVGEYGQVVSAGGFIIEVLADATDKEINSVEEKLKGFSVSKYLSMGRDSIDLLKFLAGDDAEPIDERDYVYECWCDYERLLETVLNDESIEDNTVATCIFCKKEYIIRKPKN